jgi:hypothetical protein
MLQKYFESDTDIVLAFQKTIVLDSWKTEIQHVQTPHGHFGTRPKPPVQVMITSVAWRVR